MIKTVVKLAFVALLANAAWQVFNIHWAHFKFTDVVQQTTHFRGEKTDTQLRERILELAANFDVPISDESLEIQVVDNHTLVDSSYKRTVLLAPGVRYAWPFTLHTDTYRAPSPTGELSLPK